MKRKENSLKVKKTALSAMFCALGTIILFLGGMLGDLDLTICAVASLIILLAIIEMGVKAGIMIYVATSVISLILFPMYFITPMYICFVGFYPILKYFAEKKRKVISYVIKYTTLNIMLALILIFARYFYSIEVDAMEIAGFELGKMAILIIYILANLTFFVFDFCLTKLIVLYNLKFRRVLGIYKLFR